MTTYEDTTQKMKKKKGRGERYLQLTDEQYWHTGPPHEHDYNDTFNVTRTNSI